MPAGSGVQLPAGAKLTVEIGYRGSMDERRPAPASSASISSRRRPHKRPRQSRSTPAAVDVAAGKKAASACAPKRRSRPRRTIAALWPRLGPGARSLEVTAIRPDGSVEPMLWVNNYRAEWPAPYILKEPIALPAGTRLVMTAYYDNATAAALAAKPSLSMSLLLPPSRPSATLAP